MVRDFSGLRKRVEVQFEDLLTTYRMDEEVDEVTRVASQSVGDTPVLDGIDCSLRYASKDRAGSPSTDGNQVRQTMTVFVTYNADVVRGDRVEVTTTRDGTETVMKGYASEPSKYQTHKEFRILEERPA